MTIVDRYLLTQFFKIFLICFISFSGLYVVIHVFTNLDEVVDIAGRDDGVKNLVFDFYGPRVLDFLNRTTGILILVSAVFAIAMMQRKRESVATEAAGVTKARLVRPILIAAVAIIAFAAMSRELYIPMYKSMLVRSLVDWTTDGATPMHHYKDLETGILVHGENLIVSQSTITRIQLTLPRNISPDCFEIRADQGVVVAEAANDQRPQGILLQLNIEPNKVLRAASIAHEGKPVIYSPFDTPWLKDNEIFVSCNLDVQDLAFGDSLYKYSSVKEMLVSLKKPGRRIGMGDQVAIHERIMKPLLELTLVLLGLPLVISDPNRNIFLGAAICMTIIFGVEMTVAASRTMGTYHMIRPAALAGWLPVIILFPLSAFSFRKLFD